MSAASKLAQAAETRQRLNGIAWTPRLVDVQALADALVGVGGLSHAGALRAADVALKFARSAAPAFKPGDWVRAEFVGQIRYGEGGDWRIGSDVTGDDTWVHESALVADSPAPVSDTERTEQ